MSHKSISGIPVKEGGTELTEVTKNSPLIAGPNGNDAMTFAPPGSDTTNILISNGPGSPPSFQTPPIPQMNFQVLASDPSTPGDGQVWYNSTTDLFKGAKVGAGTWTAKNAMNTARRGLGGAGDTSDGLSFGGFTTGVVGTTERWDGTNWTAKTGLNQSRNTPKGAGTAEDGLSFGGNNASATSYANTELYSGTGNTWTNKTSMNSSQAPAGGAGTEASALSFGGIVLPSTFNGITEEYVGGGTNTWTTKTAMNTTRASGGGSGSSSSSVIGYGGGNGGGTLSSTELYDLSGNSWANKSSMNTALQQFGTSNSTSATSLQFGGYAATSIITQKYELAGDTWTTVTSMNTKRRLLAGCGSASSALSFGGLDSGVLATTEEYDGAPTIVTFTVT